METPDISTATKDEEMCMAPARSLHVREAFKIEPRILTYDVTEGDDEEAKRAEFRQQFADGLFLAVSYLKDVRYIHIRRFYEAENGKWLPTKDGATFTDQRFAALLAIQSEPDERYFQWWNGQQVSSFGQFIGGGWKVSVDPTNHQIDIRKYFHTRNGSDQRRPSRTGIRFHLKEWRGLSECIQNLCDLIPELRDIVPCMNTHDSQDQMTRCVECSPYYISKSKTEHSDNVINLSLLY